jgi:diaminohydroxyphosphoribosylaminopyrimidine deaminase/5-amino-6-(5-phosphoribosylamino)uracil reductase
VRLDILTAVSMNGFITEAPGLSGDALGPPLETPRAVWERKYEIRRRYSAGMVGTDTVVVDNPSLTSHAVPGFTPIRITLDAHGRIPRGARFFDGAVRTLVGVCASTPRDYLDFLASRGVEAVPAGEERIDLAAFLAALAGCGITSIFCEGGGRLNRSLLSAGLVERIWIVVLPAVLSSGSVNLFHGPGALVRLRLASCEREGDFVWLEYEVVR